MLGSRSAFVLAAILLLGLGRPAAAADLAPAGTAPGEYRPLGPNLFPLYYGSVAPDGTESRNYAYIYSTSDNEAQGSWARLLLPFFYRGHSEEPRTDHFFLFPLLHFRKWSDAESYTYSLPLYFSRTTPESALRLLVPFWLRTRNVGGESDHILPPLFRLRTDREEPENPVRSMRMGLWPLLELGESRVDSTGSAVTALNFFNFGRPTESGLSIFETSTSRPDERTRTHLFPFWWQGSDPGGSYAWMLPLYGRTEVGGDTDHYLPFLLSRIGGSATENRLDVLFPLFHYDAGAKYRDMYSVPFFHYSSSESGSSWSVAHILYRTALNRASGKRVHAVLFPLSYFNVEPDRSAGLRWAGPYLETFGETYLWRFVFPLWYEHQSLEATETSSFVRIGLPLILSLGEPDDYFTMGFPLYWADRTGPRGFQVLFPLFWRFYTGSSDSTHIIPLVSRRSLPSRRQLVFLGPLYINEAFYGPDGSSDGSAHHVLWPLIGIESRTDSWGYKFLPFFAASRSPESRDLLVTPFYYEQEGPKGKGRYFFPFYGRRDTTAETTDYYALGTWIRSEGRNESGQVVRDADHFLWGLASFQEDRALGVSHDHVLPLAYWSTSTPVSDRTVAGPFWYSHRVAEHDEVHHLNLLLGNLFFSKVVEGPLPLEADVGPDAAPAPAPPSASAPAPAHRGEVWRDQGVLWPLARSYRSASGDRGTWAIPFYFDLRDDLSDTFAVWPFYFGRDQKTAYQMSFFRYFFLFDRETWRGGLRWTLGQFLFDWKSESATDSYRWRFLYPLVESSRTPEGSKVQLTPLIVFSSREGVVDNHIFPLYWQGSTTRKSPEGEEKVEASHWFLFPLGGYSSRGPRTDYHLLFPFFHLRDSPDATRFELWPSFFYRDEPALLAVRVWPLHADESGGTAGDFWVSRFLFLSKRFEREDGWSYRLDPFLFRVSSGEASGGFAALFELLAYDRKGDEVDFRLIPFAFGHAAEEASSLGVIPFHYRRDFGTQPIDWLVPWRFVFLTNHLRGAGGESHTGILWKLFELTTTPDSHEAAVLHRVFLDRRTPKTTQFELNPLFGYYRNEETDETEWSFLLSLIRTRRVAGATTTTLFYFLDF